MLLVTNNSSVEHAAGYGSLLVDATFGIVPSPLFYQCLTINVVEEMDGVQKLFTSLYVLMTHKKELLYDDFLAWYLPYLRDVLHVEAEHDQLMIDFERALWNAFLRAFPEMEISGCNFHFSQALEKNAVKFALGEFLHDRKSLLSIAVRSFKAIQFISNEGGDVDTAWNTLVLPQFEAIFADEDYADVAEQVRDYLGTFLSE